jgi:hypothetical protein
VILLALVTTALAGSTDEPLPAPVGEAPKSASAADKREVTFGLWLQPDLRATRYLQVPLIDLGDGGSPVRTSGEIGLRRARLSAKLKAAHGWSARMELKGDDGKIGIGDCYATYEPTDGLAFSAGQLRGPAGLEQATSTKDLPFLSRGLVSALGSERNLAIEADAAAGPVLVQLAAAKGAHAKDYPDATNLDVLGRISVAPIKSVLIGVHGVVLTRPNGAPGFAFEGDVPLGVSIEPRTYTRGSSYAAGADLSFATDPLRASVEAATLIEGVTGGTVASQAVHSAISGTVGVGLPGAEHDKAADGGGLQDGAELLARAQYGQSVPGQGDAGTLRIIEVGAAWIPIKNVRVQFEAGWESMHGGGNATSLPLAPASAFTATLWAGVGF